MEDFATDLARFRSHLKSKGLGEGARLPAEAELADQLGVTRNRIRRLLKVVETEGLIWRHVGKGTFIGNRSVAESFHALPEQTSPLEIFEARLLVEPKLAALAAVRAVQSEIDEMRRCVADMKLAADMDEWSPLDAKLHRIIAKAARNTLLLTVHNTIRESFPSGMKSRIRTVYSARSRTEDNEHDALVEAIADHDPESAEQLMKSHIEAVRHRLFGII